MSVLKHTNFSNHWPTRWHNKRFNCSSFRGSDQDDFLGCVTIPIQVRFYTISRGSVTRFFASGLLHEPSSPKPLPGCHRYPKQMPCTRMIFLLDGFQGGRLGCGRSKFIKVWGKVLFHRLNMELDLQCLFGLHVYTVQMCSLAETPHPPPLPRIWAHIRGRYWSAKIDDISLWPPVFS